MTTPTVDVPQLEQPQNQDPMSMMLMQMQQQMNDQALKQMQMTAALLNRIDTQETRVDLLRDDGRHRDKVEKDKEDNKPNLNHKKYLDSRDFSDFTKFKGIENDFPEFQHKLMCAVGISSDDAKKELESASKADVATLFKDKLDPEQNNISMEFYNRLCLICLLYTSPSPRD